ncbi:MFS transporter [Paenibacillus antri]|uniref:MFS transporter n=1 Tax=Paenibacillus antri TaxID=2582848 RepID=A0A5R9GI10_9BACL|nr:MFS transporter [Paenibacillus antri]TLS54136.1 MFS transporter [Paenibacillus antri]
MSENPKQQNTETLGDTAKATVFPILLAVSVVHLLNDTMQSTVSSIFPILRDELDLSYAQIGMITLAMNLTASLLQPLIGLFADKRPLPIILPVGVCFTLAGIITLALAPTYALILLAVTMMGVGSAIFHPESSRVAYLAAGRRRGLAQSIFQVGGNFGSALGPIMTAVLFVHVGQFGVIWFAFAAIAGIAIQTYVARWYGKKVTQLEEEKKRKAAASPIRLSARPLTRGRIAWAMTILILLVMSKNVYIASMSSYFTFHLIDGFGLSIANAQWFLFAFLAASAVGTFVGGPMADRFGRRNIIWASVLGTAPFSILLPFANLFWTGVLAVFAGFILSSAFSIIVVYAQELVPGKVGFVAGLFFGLAFGMGALGAATLGWLADMTSITLVMVISGFLPLFGVLTAWLPKDDQLRG